MARRGASAPGPRGLGTHARSGIQRSAAGLGGGRITHGRQEGERLRHGRQVAARCGIAGGLAGTGAGAGGGDQRDSRDVAAVKSNRSCLRRIMNTIVASVSGTISLVICRPPSKITWVAIAPSMITMIVIAPSTAV